MAAAVMPTISIAGLHRAPKGRDLEISRAVHNTLPHPEEQPEISDTMLKASDGSFVAEFADFLRRNNLADLLALELLDGPQNNIQKELQVGPQATVLFHEEDVIGLSLPTITTGWSFKLGDDGIISYRKSEGFSPLEVTEP
ncbi:hypothetical protein HYQ46_012595 [Verticillium longisporum]|nr:hypothetical protein HYQ44_001090 [Verticillium longisporum]KAG7151615.1 hypothetical protein HYQ46_012595 [Verticillium longisporum]